MPEKEIKHLPNSKFLVIGAIPRVENPKHTTNDYTFTYFTSDDLIEAVDHLKELRSNNTDPGVDYSFMYLVGEADAGLGRYKNLEM